ncbi:MAG TPA: MFS transporter [Solirubrobacteraceae bacterium]|jgi:MFS family permease|nr:MFS transporter [Solirubrobacteraceae bacterium]
MSTDTLPQQPAAAASATVTRGIIRTNIPARLDRLPWSRFHWRVIIGLGTVWILDGLQVTIVGAVAARLTEHGSGIRMSSASIGTAGAIYVAGGCVGALLFGQLTDRYGRRKLFMLTLAVYLLATVATAFAFAPWYFFLFRFLTGMGIGGEYAAINSAIDELIPARNRGRADLAINGSYWVGSAIGGFAALLFLDTSLFARDVGWRLAFGVGAVLGLGIMIVRRSLPESPRWLFIHGHEDEAERIVEQIEAEVQQGTGAELPEPEGEIAVRQRDAIPFRELAKVALTRYPRRALLGFALFVGQAFLYNAVVFDLGTLLHAFFGVGSGTVPYYMALFALGNFLGPLLLGRFFDTIGRIPMISGTYLGSATLVAVLGVLLITSHLTLWEFMGFVLAAFFLASAGASSAYLTVSEVFPMETRALAIAFFFAIGTATGGIVGPVLFGQLIHSGSRHLVAIGFFVGAGAMAIGGLIELLFGVSAEGQSLENIAKPLTVEEAEELLPLPLVPELRPNPQAYHERHEAVHAREQAESERAVAAERRAALQELHGRVGAAEAMTPPDRADREAEAAELHAQGLDELATTHEQRALAMYARTEPERLIAAERAAAAEERARIYQERAAALTAETGAEAETHMLLAEAAAERAREREQRALAVEARAEAAKLRSGAAELARARAEMHESWAAVHNARSRAFEARAHHDDTAAATHEQEAGDRELIALAAEQRVDAAEHRARAEALQEEDALLSQAEREQRIRDRSGQTLSHGRRGLHRFQPGVGSTFYSPGLIGTAGTTSRLAAMAREQLDREIDLIGRALEEHGPLEHNELKRLVGGQYWGPGRFRQALRAAISEGRARRRSRDVVEPPLGSRLDTQPAQDGPGRDPAPVSEQPQARG